MMLLTMHAQLQRNCFFRHTVSIVLPRNVVMAVSSLTLVKQIISCCIHCWHTQSTLRTNHLLTGPSASNYRKEMARCTLPGTLTLVTNWNVKVTRPIDKWEHATLRAVEIAQNSNCRHLLCSGTVWADMNTDSPCPGTLLVLFLVLRWWCSFEGHKHWWSASSCSCAQLKFNWWVMRKETFLWFDCKYWKRLYGLICWHVCWVKSHQKHSEKMKASSELNFTPDLR